MRLARTEARWCSANLRAPSKAASVCIIPAISNAFTCWSILTNLAKSFNAERSASTLFFCTNASNSATSPASLDGMSELSSIICILLDVIAVKRIKSDSRGAISSSLFVSTGICSGTAVMTGRVEPDGTVGSGELAHTIQCISADFKETAKTQNDSLPFLSVSESNMVIQDPPKSGFKTRRTPLVS